MTLILSFPEHRSSERSYFIRIFWVFLKYETLKSLVSVLAGVSPLFSRRIRSCPYTTRLVHAVWHLLVQENHNWLARVKIAPIHIIKTEVSVGKRPVSGSNFWWYIKRSRRGPDMAETVVPTPIPRNARPVKLSDHPRRPWYIIGKVTKQR